MLANKIVALVFAVMFLAFFLTGLIGMTITGNFIAKCEETTGVVTRIEHGEAAYARYTVGTKEYERRLDAYTSNMRIGKELKLFYDPQNPSSIATDEIMLVWLILRYVGYGCLIISVILYLIGNALGERHRLLLETGRRIPCAITGVKEIASVSMGRAHPYRLECRSQDGKTYVSPYLWQNPSDRLTTKTVDVCVDDHNDRRYAVDITSCGLDKSCLYAKRERKA